MICDICSGGRIVHSPTSWSVCNFCNGTAWLPRKTLKDLELEKVPSTDLRWLLFCKFPTCSNILFTNEYILCSEHR